MTAQNNHESIPFKGNIGLWYYRTFFNEYHKLKPVIKSDEKKFTGWLKDECNSKLEAKLSDYTSVSDSFSDIAYHKNTSFNLKTIYPGLVCGIGYEHELGFTNEFKLGFLFDHTTGLPYIPGSSVKGTLRSAFRHKGYPKSILTGWINAIEDSTGTKNHPWKGKSDEEISEKYVTIKTLAEKVKWGKLEDHIFEGIEYSSKEQINPYKTDTFFDAFIFKTSANNENMFLADDYITCHQNRKHPELTPFTNPNPVRFLKVRSDVEFTFGFRLVDTEIDDMKFSAEIKVELFKQILLDIGIGAKTNVGYGQFEPVH